MTAAMASRDWCVQSGTFFRTAAVLWLWFVYTSGFQLQDAREVYYNDEGTGLWPPLMNLAKHAKVTANGTCGMTQPEVICRRRSAQCKLTLCDPRRHGPRRVVDGSKESWISPTLEGGLELQYITLTIDLKQVYQISYITVKAGIAPRPAAMILERSIDGEMFLPWQFFAETDEECLDRFGVPASLGKVQLSADDEVTCTTQYSKPFPPENGEINTSLVSGRNTSSEIVRDFTSARYIRLRFQRMFTTARDLALKKRLFYAIRTIAIGGQCICNGHASKCLPDEEGVPSCECEHGTCGKHCETCCPLKEQQLWKPGTTESANACHNCQCFGHASACRYNAVVAATKLSLDTKGQYRGGGECLNCTDHTTGVNCERCEKGWFRPLGIRPDDASPCVACDCHPVGSIGSCAHDDSQPGKMAGWCECQEGFAGAKCDRCATGWRGFPTCERCPCDPRGTVQGPTCDGNCTCKKNVEGEKCDKCIAGYFGLRLDNPDGCTQCFCSGLGAECEESSPVPFNVSEAILEEWLISDLQGEHAVTASMDPETGLLYIGHYEAPNVDSYFWRAPASLVGNLLNAYGEMALVAQVGWEAMRGDTSGEPTRAPTVVLAGENGIRIGFGDEIFEGTKGEVKVHAPLIETSWYMIPSHIQDISEESNWEFRGSPVTRQQFLSVLTSVKYLLVRAYFHTDQAEASLTSAALESSRSSSEDVTPLLEMCNCPPGYGGYSCERCSFGYYRSNATSECLPCPCNGHADCDPETNICEECQHNTEGDQCELCPDGYYGNATVGTANDCLPCLCPSESPRSFSSTCEADGDDYVCTACEDGYTGNHCQECAIGFYGNPAVEDGNCTKCDCKGGPCDGKTGQCLECKGNTVGARCESCRPLHFGDPIHEGCKECECDTVGSEDLACNRVTGKCLCKLGFAGRNCGTCDAGFGNLSAECPPCHCGLASKGGSCDAFTGACSCQQGAEPPLCDSCLPLHFGLNKTGCQGCACDPSGSESAACDIVSGQCPCRGNVSGRACDRCLEEHWGLAFGKGCRPCNCDVVGSQGADCDLATGQCRCKPGVGGSRCDACFPGYFGFSDAGCQGCERCDHDGYVCHPDSGRCVCPPNTQGPRCQSCASHSWGFKALLGCSTCDCDTGGAVRGQCDFTTGQCECRPGYTGQQCNRCADGHYGFPVCRPCQCDLAGSLTSECDESGLCNCKPNAQGAKCDQCLPGTFALQAENPNGCTACFCFGRSASCTQAGLSWSQIRASRPRAVSVEYDPSPPFQNTLPIDTQEICYINLAVPGGGEVALNGFDRGLNVTNNLRTIPGDTEDVKIGVSFLFDTPVYWQLPKQFLSDKVLSYGGFLKFRVESEGGDTKLPPGVLVTYPLIQLQGNGRLVLEHYPILPNPNGHYQVRFHESLWMEKNPRRPASRETLMVALQNVQYILIRASDAVDFTRLVLKDVSMDTAAVTAGAAHAVADGVEVCECPPEYNSTSCQDPSIGFYRWFNRTHSTATILISLIGEARPCECNGRSSICDTETGYCKSCANYTGGDHCERCADGFYGDPALGPCLSCPCPSPMQNFASACRIHPGREPVCFCREGYTGLRCDRCAYGWFGHPELPGGFCQPCECHPFGSVSDECHEQTGQCNCKRGILGLDCSICPDRTVLTAKGCSTCEDGCTGILLKDLDAMKRHLQLEAAHVRSKQDMPWWKLQELVAGPLTDAKRLLDEWEIAAGIASRLVEDADPRRLAIAVQPLFEQAGELTELSDTVSKTAAMLKASSEKLTLEVYSIRNSMDAVVRNLFQYSGDARVSDAAALMEARRLLEKITSRYFEPRRKQAEQILDICHHALNNARMVNATYPILHDVISRVELLKRQLDDFQDLIQTVLTDAEKRVIQAGELRRKLRGVSEKVGRAKAGLSEIFEMHDEANNYLDNAEDALMAMDNNYNNLTNVRGGLKNSSLILERKEGILYGLNPLYRSKYVTPAQEHANALARLAHDYQQLFNATIADAGDALKASKAYEEVVGSVESAREAAEVATVSADIALKQAFPSVNEDSMMERAEISKSVSSRLLTRASTPRNGSSVLQTSLRQQQSDVIQLENTVREVGSADNNVARELKSLENMKVGERIDNSLSQMASVDAQMAETKESVLKITEEVNNKLRPQLILLANEVKEFDLLKARENIEESLKAHQRASDMVRKLSEEMELRRQRHSFRHTNETLSRAFINLRNKITEARHAAQGIRLSLRSTKGKECVRSFKVPGLEPTIANRLVITVSLAPTDKNGLLFYLPSSTTTDFLAVELVNGRVRFVWDLGGGPSVVTKPLNDDPKVVLPKIKWYKIIAERTSYLGKLWVVPGGKSEGDVATATNSSAVEFSWMDVGPTDRLWVGGFPPNQEPPPLLHSTAGGGLIGCLNSIILDDTPVGLWNFYRDHTGGCSACIQGAEEVTDESTYRFNGEGYSVLRHAIKSTYNKYQFTVSLRFKTYDDNAVLFVAVSMHKERYITLLLRDGRVVFQIGYGGDSQLEMSSSKRYNDGKWTTIEASRSFDRRRGIEKGLLKVGDETKEAAPPSPPTQAEIPDLSNADYLVGGTPQGYNFGQLHLRLPKSFLGCMSDLFVDKELYTPLRGRSNGVTPSCVDQVVKVAGFHGDGYLQLGATLLKKKSAFGLVLRTLQADAIVLLATEKQLQDEDVEDDSVNAIEEDTTTAASTSKHESYYSVALVDGRVEVRVEAGRGAITLVSQAVVNDGRFHAILVTKTNRRLDLRVDDELQASSTLPEGANSVRVKDLFLGGAPKSVDVGRYVSDVTPFTGTLKDLLFNYGIISLEPVNKASGVELGRPGPEREDAALLPSLRRPWSPSPGCRRARKYVVDPRAVKFGDAPNSHVQIALRRRGPPAKNFTLELDFRTFYPDGLLFLVPAAHKAGGMTKQFLLGNLRNGQLHIIAKTKNKVEILSGTHLNDGTWHHVAIVREERKLSVSVDFSEPAVAKLPKKINTGTILYIGGLPEGGLLLPRNLMARMEGLRGCVRNLAINNQTEDLIGDKGQHERVGQCFPQVEPGSYFSGDAYIVHRKNFRIEDLLRLKLDFRTSELAGVLFSITDPLGYPAFSLEFAPGKVIFSGDTGDRRMFRLVHELESQFAVCDNRWHRISVSYEAEEVVMVVDQNVSKIPLLRNDHFLFAYLDAPLYIGGLPEHIVNGKPLLETRDNFKGCLRNLMIAGENKDWTDMYSLHNVLVGSCPAVTQH